MRAVIIVEGKGFEATFEERIGFGKEGTYPNQELSKLLEKVVGQARTYMAEKVK